MPVCSKTPLLYLLTQKTAQKFGYVLGIFYNKGIEVDFYIPEEELAIQVSYSVKDEDTRKREVKALLAIENVLACRRRLIITYDEEDAWQLSAEGIEVIPVWKWLLK